MSVATFNARGNEADIHQLMSHASAYEHRRAIPYPRGASLDRVSSKHFATAMPPRVLVAMSGGVDSSVAAALLARDGYEVIGVTFNQWPAELMARSTGNGCCTPDTIDDARRVCAILGVPHYVIDYRQEFEAAVIAPWVQAYLDGKTPNPCVMCNRTVRFGTFLTKADELGADFIATGHYARIKADQSGGRLRLLAGKGRDEGSIVRSTCAPPAAACPNPISTR